MDKSDDSILRKEIPKLKSVNLGGFEFLINSVLGYYPYYSMALRNRVKNKKANNNVVTGEGGIGKSYQASDICRVLSKISMLMILFLDILNF